MILEEGIVVNLANGGRYYLAHEIGELEGIEGKIYYFAAGVTENELVNEDDIGFLEFEKEDDGYSVTKVAEDSELYQQLTYLEAVSTALETVPGFQNKLEEALKNDEEGSN